MVNGVGIRCEPEVRTDVKQNVAVKQPLSGPFRIPGQSERSPGEARSEWRLNGESFDAANRSPDR